MAYQLECAIGRAFAFCQYKHAGEEEAYASCTPEARGWVWRPLRGLSIACFCILFHPLLIAPTQSMTAPLG